MKKKILSMIATTLVISSCSENPNLSLYINKYQNFEEFKNHLSVLESVRAEGDFLVFDPEIEGSLSNEYKVIGVDYKHVHGHKGEGLCDTLYYREAYALVNMPNPVASFVVSYRAKQEDSKSLVWVKNNKDGYPYSSISLKVVDGEPDVGYSLTNKDSKSLLYIRFSSPAAVDFKILEEIKANYEKAANV